MKKENKERIIQKNKNVKKKFIYKTQLINYKLNKRNKEKNK